MVNESVILVDTNDQTLGTMEKMEAHRLGKLHRAISVFVFNRKGELLMQQRAAQKYHSAGKWSNTTCSHPRLGEQNIDAATRRLKEEMGLDCNLVYGFNFIYQANFGNGLFEHEYDHVFFGITDVLPQLNIDEVSAFRYNSLEELGVLIKQNPDEYTTWLKICFEQVVKHYHQLQKND